MRGDGHTAYENGSPDCIDPKIETYLNTLTLPAVGTSCHQAIPFAQPQQSPQLAKTLAAPATRVVLRRLHLAH
jgi:TAP-like protein